MRARLNKRPADSLGRDRVLHFLEAGQGGRAHQAIVAAPDRVSILEGLSKHPNGTVRAFALDEAPRVIRRQDAERLLRAALDDPDPDVQQIARDELVELVGPDTVLPRLRALVASSNETEALQIAAAIWNLVDLGDLDSLPLLERVASQPPVPFIGHSAAAAVLVFTHRDDVLASLILEHDHDRTPSLVAGALRLPTAKVVHAMSEAVRSDPNSLCRSEFDSALRAIAARSNRAPN